MNPQSSAGRASVLDAIGNTPIAQLRRVAGPDAARVLVKLEFYSPTGSYKDRSALEMIEAAEERGDLRPGMTVVEYSGGSTGSSLAFVCAVKGYRCQIVTSDAFALEKLQTMRAFGAELVVVPSPTGKITPEVVRQVIERAEQLGAADDVYFTNQLHNRDVISGYEGIGAEILAQVDGQIDAFCAGVGTAGMLMGVSRALRRTGRGTRIAVLEPASSAVISGGASGPHHVDGIGLGFVPPMLEPEAYDEVLGIDEAEARAMARRLAAEEGIFAGTSTGLNVVGAVQLARELGPNHTVVTVAVDTGLKYLAGDLFPAAPHPG